jgi:hypothetical protein
MWTQDMDRLLYGAQFMTEKIGGSDAGAAELRRKVVLLQR